MKTVRISLFAVSLAFILAPCANVKADSGSMSAGDLMYEQGLTHYDAGEYREALHVWLRMSHLRDPDAAYAVGVIYEHGLGVKPDLGTALNWYRYAASFGSPEAKRRLAGDADGQNLER